MNKKFVAGAVAGFAVLAAGAFAVVNGGDSDSAARPAQAAHEDFADSSGALGSPTSDQAQATLPSSPVSGENNPAGTPAVEPSASPIGDDTPGSSPSSPVPAQPPTTGEEPSPTPGGPADGSSPASDPGQPGSGGQGPTVIQDPRVTDAVCDLLGCDDPVLPYNSAVANSICQAIHCDDSIDVADSPVSPCELIPSTCKPNLTHFKLGMGLARRAGT